MKTVTDRLARLAASGCGRRDVPVDARINVEIVLNSYKIIVLSLNSKLNRILISIFY